LAGGRDADGCGARVAQIASQGATPRLGLVDFMKMGAGN
jgi:hypothetical protein